jgi:hypothetical protein
MKNIKIKFKYTFLALAGMLIMAACSEELELSPLDSFSNETFWTSESNAMLALTGVYRGNILHGVTAAPSDWWSYSGWIFLDMSTDNAYDRRGDNAPFNRLSNGTMNPNNVNLLEQYWQRSYQRIARSNFFIENVVKTPMSEQLINRMTAEARFIRAAQYHYLSISYGAVPLVTETLTLEEANTADKTPKDQVVQFVIDELSAIVNDLPQASEMPAGEFGRASKQAALALLGRAQLTDGRYAEAASSYKAIIDMGDHVIDPDYKSLFNGSNEASSELIFSTVFLIDLASHGILQHAFPAVKGGWHIINPLGDLAESYEFTDGTPFSFDDPKYDPDDYFKNRDPRLSYNIMFDGSDFGGVKYVTHPDSVNSIDRVTTNRQATRTGFGIRKFMVEDFGGDLRNSGLDLPIFRYAEVLLGYLEAKLENGDPIDQALLDATINQVRGRASVNMPPVTETNPAELREILRRERRNEFAFEGLRYWDLLRWGTAAEELSGSFYGGPFPGAVNLRVDGANADPYSRWFVTKKSFRAGVDDRWPIPQSEVNINPKLAD